MGECDSDRPAAEPDRQARNETPAEQLDRNLSGLLQELRVVQTGVQLPGFLLTLPFQARFATLSMSMREVYLAVVAASIAATVFLTALVAAHRLLFRRRRLETVVRAGHRFALMGLILLGLALTGVAVLIFDTVAGSVAAVIAGVACAASFITVRGAHPLRQRLHPH
ncbi:sodium:proton antiporter [Nocardia sp. NEAU-G5]|uniref:Sodium:proton antiporter n=1 Tax=Nocardia albiluteola TaxID=2842303 RepID=A0ABS6B6S2_9NOCA|nr:DUF6328 family protein [Nocardia albiluteola]MBU3066004.1 sodium:proton antiporter [Nocardia albiluteola]